TATISSAATGFGALIALKVPQPTTCPSMKILNERVDGNLQFTADGEGIITVQVQCTWTETCSGAIALLDPATAAGGDVEVPAGERAEVTIGMCGQVVTCGSEVSEPQSDADTVAVSILLRAPNGQYVSAEDPRGDTGTLNVP